MIRIIFLANMSIDVTLMHDNLPLNVQRKTNNTRYVQCQALSHNQRKTNITRYAFLYWSISNISPSIDGVEFGW